MKTSQPTAPGWYEFEGWRSTPSGKFMVSIKDLVKVQPGVKAGTYRVLTAGSATQYSTELYEGTWQPIATLREPAAGLVAFVEGAA